MNGPVRAWVAPMDDSHEHPFPVPVTPTSQLLFNS